MKKLIYNYGQATFAFGSVLALVLIVTYMAVTYGCHNPIASY